MRRYGVWTGNPRGIPEDLNNCIDEVSHDGFKSYQCSKPRGYGPKREYCRIHTKRLERDKAIRREIGHPYIMKRLKNLTFTYDRKDSITFRKTREKWGGLSNFSGGMNLKVNGIYISTNEHLYQAMKFPHLPDLQKRIIEAHSPMMSKSIARSDMYRLDWEDIKVRVMYWTLKIKLLHNREFGELLLESGENTIVEDSYSDNYWGAMPKGDGLEGCNVLGRLLMRLRGQYRKSILSFENSIEPIKVNEFKIYGRKIHKQRKR